MLSGRNKICLVLAALAISPLAMGDIELRKTVDAASGNIEAKTVFSDIDEDSKKPVIIEGLCQPAPVEGKCNRTFAELEIVKTVPDQKYRTKLAEIFGIEPGLAIRKDALEFIDSQMKLEEKQGNAANAKSLVEVMNRVKDLENITKFLKAEKSVSISANMKSYAHVEFPFGRITKDKDKKGYLVVDKREFPKLNKLKMEFYLMPAVARAKVDTACPAGTIPLNKEWVKRLGSTLLSPVLEDPLKTIHGGKASPWEVWLSDVAVDSAKTAEGYRNSWMTGNEGPAKLFPPPYAGGKLFAGPVTKTYAISGTTYFAALEAEKIPEVKSSEVSTNMTINWRYVPAFPGSAVQVYQADHSMKSEAELRSTVLSVAAGTLPLICLDY